MTRRHAVVLPEPLGDADIAPLMAPATQRSRCNQPARSAAWDWRRQRRRSVLALEDSARVVSAEQVEADGSGSTPVAAGAGSQRRAGAVDHPQTVKRLRMPSPSASIPFTQGGTCGRWLALGISLIGSQDAQRLCMPGGKIAFYFGILAAAAARRRRGKMIMATRSRITARARPRAHRQAALATRGAIRS